MGIVVSLDVVAIHDAGVIFREIVGMDNDIMAVLKEIERNGLDVTKKLARQEFSSYYNENGKLGFGRK